MRTTKGQHTKTFDDQPLEPPKKRGRRKKQREEEPEEVIRCVCGATEQDGESEEPWIACDKCGAWQHNVCMGMSVFSEDLPKHYYCEQCSPQDHKELLAAMAKGEQPWEQRRKKYEEAQGEKKKRRRKPGRPAKVPQDATKDDASQTASTRGDDSPAPESSSKPKEKTRKETGKPGTGKRKSQDDAEKDVKVRNCSTLFFFLFFFSPLLTFHRLRGLRRKFASYLILSQSEPTIFLPRTSPPRSPTFPIPPPGLRRMLSRGPSPLALVPPSRTSS